MRRKRTILGRRVRTGSNSSSFLCLSEACFKQILEPLNLYGYTFAGRGICIVRAGSPDFGAEAEHSSEVTQL
jgi:hypothetical protein